MFIGTPCLKKEHVKCRLFVQICMVNENLEVVYHSYVKPESRIVDYLTRYSGITAEHLVNVNTRLVLVYPIPF